MRWVGYQQRWLRDRASIVAANKSRQVGFSEVEAFKRACRALGFWQLLGFSQPFKPMPQNIISASERQSLDLLRRVKVHLEALAEAAWGKSAIVHDNAHEIVLANGVRLRAFAPNPRTIRSVNGDVTLDEFAANMNAEAVWKVVFPMVQANLGNRTGGWQLSIISTPEGDSNKFHEIMRDPKFNHVSRHTVPIQVAAADGFPLPKSIEQMKAEYGDPDAWEQEYECSFLASSMRYISDKIWEAAAVDPDSMPEPPRDAALYGGFDVGRHHDASAYHEVAYVGDSLWQNGLTEYEHKLAFDVQDAWMDRKVAGLLRFAIDAGGMGEVPAERLSNLHGARIVPTKFTSQTKEILATGFKLMLDRKKYRPRTDDLKLRREVLLMRREVSDRGNIRFDIQREKGAHGDGAWAAMLAVHASGLATKRTEPLRPDALMPRDQPDPSGTPYEPLWRRPDQRPYVTEDDGWTGNGPFRPTRRRAWE